MIPIYVELEDTDVKPFPGAYAYQVDGHLCWGVHIAHLTDLLDLLDHVGGTLTLTLHGAFSGIPCIILPRAVSDD